MEKQRRKKIVKKADQGGQWARLLSLSLQVRIKGPFPHFDEIFGHLPGEGPGDMIPGEGDVGSDGQAKEGADGQEHGVGGDEGEDEDADRGEDEGAVHHKQRVHKCKIGKPPQHSISSSLQNKRHDN